MPNNLGNRPNSHPKYTSHKRIAPSGVGTPTKYFPTLPASVLILKVISLLNPLII